MIRGQMLLAREMATPERPPLRWLISCDESGVNGNRHYAFGSLWMPWQRRGDFSAALRELKARHRYDHEIKWTSVKSRSLPFYVALIEWFFQTAWVSFQCVVVERATVRKECHKGDYDLARRKHLTMLVTNKIKARAKAHRGREQSFRVRTDPIHSYYAKADEALLVITNAVLNKALGSRQLVDDVVTRDSKDTPSIQLSDLLLGAVAAAWEGDVRAETKLTVQKCIAEHLGWKHLRHDTKRDERKFNVWVFFDPVHEIRRAQTLPVQLRYPLPPRRSVSG